MTHHYFSNYTEVLIRDGFVIERIFIDPKLQYRPLMVLNPVKFATLGS